VAAGGRLGRLDRLEAAALDRTICRMIDRMVDESVLYGWERDAAVAAARRFHVRVARHRVAGLGLRDAAARVMAEDGLDDGEIRAVLDAVLAEIARF
jgi:hypothetical protein